MYDLSVVPCPDYDAVDSALASLLEPLGGLSWVQRGMRVLLKANLVGPYRAQSGAVTHPSLLTALARMIVAQGGEAIIADSPGGPFTRAAVEVTYRVSGARQATNAGARLNDNFDVSEKQEPAAKIAKSITACAYLDDSDAVIDVCKLKTHGMMGMSGAAKNLFGIIPGTMKPEYHFRYPNPADFADMIVDLSLYAKPRLCVCDAVVAMEGNGPTAGKPRAVGALLAGFNPHALDLACAKLIGLKMNDVPTLRAAHDRGLIPERADELRVAGDLNALVVPDFDTIQTYHSLRFATDSKNPLSIFQNRVLPALLAPKPAVSPQACVQCGKCASLCPAKAISLRKTPVINRRQCIRCFCCQEFCPKGAIKVRRPLVARILVEG